MSILLREFTVFSIPLAHLTIHRHKSLLAINDDI